VLSLNAEQKNAYDSYTAGVSNNDNQFLLMIGGEGGTGKSLLIRAMVLWAKIHFGKTKSIFGRSLTMTPTGSSAFNVDGFTWQSALNKGKTSKKGEKVPRAGLLKQAACNKLQAKLDGVRVIIMDEKSLISLQDLADISRRLQSAQRNEVKRKLPFGGLHVVLSGDLYQIAPPGGDAVYSTTSTDSVARQGRDLWMLFRTFKELTHTHRYKQSEIEMKEFASLARRGLNIPNRLLDSVNQNVVLSLDEANEKANPGALW